MIGNRRIFSPRLRKTSIRLMSGGSFSQNVKGKSLSKKSLFHVQSKLFSSSSVETIAVVEGDVFEIRQELVKPLFSGDEDPSRKIQKVLYSQSISKISSFTEVSTSDPKLFDLSVNLADGSSDLISDCKLPPNWTGFLKQLIDPDFVTKVAFFLCDTRGNFIPKLVAIDIFKDKLVFFLPKDGNVAFSGDAVEDTDQFVLSGPISKEIGFSMELFNGEIEKFDVTKKQIRASSIALFAPLPLISLAIPAKKVTQTFEVDNRVFELKISGPGFQVLAYAGAGMGNFERLLTMQSELQKAIVRFAQ